jgi:hypothetical protein
MAAQMHSPDTMLMENIINALEKGEVLVRTVVNGDSLPSL